MGINMQKVKKQAEELLERFVIPSVSITCYHDGIFETVTAGYKDQEKKILADEKTVYSVGSVTKSFTAAAIGVLCDQGLITLDDPVKKYIPEFGMFDPYVSEHLTIRDTLCHRCGLARHELAWYSRLDQYGEKEYLEMLKHLEPNVPFRYKMQYQNVMFALAGIVIHRVSGLTWKDFVQKNLIEPLKLGHISYDADELLTFEERAIGYHFFDEPTPANYEVPYSQLNAMGSAGSISMTSRQLAEWDAMFVNHGKALDGTQVISGEFCKEMTSPQMLISDPIIPPMAGVQDMTSYGLGLFMESYRGVKVLHHGGHIDGFIAYQCIVPSRNFACTVLTNSENLFGARVMRYLILDAMLGTETTDWMNSFLDYKKEQESRMASELTSPEKLTETSRAYPCPVALSELAGTYYDPGYADLKVTVEDGKVLARLGTLTLTGLHYRVQYFLFRENHVLPGVELPGTVDYDVNGKVTGLSIALELQGGEMIHFKKQN